ncbi:unnamed protein product [Schistosoma rodhaini]|uniref:Tetraspanin n=1 Tax=Schistosoma rodhaini TaxID=6188 RepID=A0A183RCX5_9TREM|nr:unnamed protein product [Schistosoma rodhaini]
MKKLSFSAEVWTKIFIVVNSLFIVFSFIMFALGISALDTLLKYSTIIQVAPPAIFGTVIFTGLVGIIASSVGFLGLWKKMKMIAFVHMIGLGIATFVNICIAIAAVATQDQYASDVQQSLLSSISNYNQTSYSAEFDSLQTSFYCCGATSYKDYVQYSMKIPPSCRVRELTYATGCIEEIAGFAQQYSNILIGLCFLTAILQGVYLGISIWMIRKSDDGIAFSA